MKSGTRSFRSLSGVVLLGVSLSLEASVRLEPARDLYVGQGSTVPLEVAVGDFDSDGKPDVVAVAYGTNDVAFLKGDGRGGLAYSRSIPVGLGPTSVAAADLDGDGRLDLAVALGRENTLAILRGNGDGTFGPPDRYSTGGLTASTVAVGDLDLDGIPDVVVGHAYGPHVSVFRGTGGGALRLDRLLDNPYGVGNILIARMDSDRWPDIVGSDLGTAIIAWGSEGGATAFSAYGGAFSLTSVAVADLDGDGNLDLVTASNGRNKIFVELGRGDRTFEPATILPLSGAPLALVDVTGDGKLDIRTRFRTVPGNGDGTFGAPFDAPYAGTYPVVADLDGDGKSEIVGADYYGDSVLVVRGEAVSRTGLGDQPKTVLVVDLDGDGTPEMVVWEVGAQRLRILRKAVDGRFAPAGESQPTDRTSTYYDPVLLSADVDLDGRPDVVTGGLFEGCHVYVNDGNGGLRAGTKVFSFDSFLGLGVIDVDGDGFPDLVFADNSLRFMKGNGDGTFESPQTLDPSYTPGVTTADMNGDGRPDLVTATYADLSWRLSLPTGGLSPPVAFPNQLGSDSGRILVTDVNGDGFPDVVGLPFWFDTAPRLNVALGRDGGISAGFLSQRVRGTVCGLFDVDGDGLDDVLAADAAVVDQGRLRAYSARATEFESLACEPLPTGGAAPSGLASVDVDGDGVSDLVVCNAESNRISYFRASPVGAIAPGDVDGDGDADVFDNLIIQAFIVGNIQAESAPFLRPATAADVDANGAVDLFDVLRHAGDLVGNRSCF